MVAVTPQGETVYVVASKKRAARFIDSEDALLIRDRGILAMHRDGMTNREIGITAKLNPEYVRQLLKQLATIKEMGEEEWQLDTEQ